LSWIGPGGPIRKTITAITGGLGSYLGEKATGDVAGAFIGGAAGGAIGGFGTGMRGLPQRVPKAIRAATEEQALKAASKASYAQLGQFNQYKLKPHQAENLNNGIKNYLENTFDNTQPFPQLLADKTWKVLDQYLPNARTVADVERVRQVLNQVRVEGGNEALASSKAIEALDDWMLNLPEVSGVAKSARADWAAYKRGQIIEETIRRGVERAHTSGKGGGGNIVNTIKQEFRRRIVDKPNVWNKFSKQEQAEIQLIINPGARLNVAHWISNFSPRHPITGAIGLFASGEPLTQLATLTSGEIAHQFTKRMTQGRAGRLLEATRARSPAGGNFTPRPAVPATERARYGAARALGATALSPDVTEAIELPEIKVTPQ
jgi:hypothetical protein